MPIQLHLGDCSPLGYFIPAHMPVIPPHMHTSTYAYLHTGLLLLAANGPGQLSIDGKSKTK